jgi:RNA polymerase sigma-70 factor (ECF subfamily)
MVAFQIPSRPVPVLLNAERAARAAESRAAALHDATLVQRFNAGDELAFSEIVTRYRAKMLQVALSRLGNRADAEEIAQDTFIRAHRALGAFRGESSLAAWLYRITLNLSHNRHWYFFRRRRHATMSLDAAFSDTNASTIADLIPSEDASPVQEACVNEFSGTVAACMAQLPPNHREILVLRNVQQHSYLQISRKLGIRVGTAKSRIGRARLMLRTLLGKSYPELRDREQSLTCFEPMRSAHGLEACA